MAEKKYSSTVPKGTSTVNSTADIVKKVLEQSGKLDTVYVIVEPEDRNVVVGIYGSKEAAEGAVVEMALEYIEDQSSNAASMLEWLLEERRVGVKDIAEYVIEEKWYEIVEEELGRKGERYYRYE